MSRPATPPPSRTLWIAVWILAYVLSFLCAAMVGAIWPFRVVVGASIGLLLMLLPYALGRGMGHRRFGERALAAGAVLGAATGAMPALPALPLAIVAPVAAIILTVAAAGKEPVALPPAATQRRLIGPGRAAPSSRSRLWSAFTGRWAVRAAIVALLLMSTSLLAHTLGFALTHVDDRAGILRRLDLHRFEDYLAAIERESGVDIRFLFVDKVPGGSLEQFAVREARALGIGRELDRRSMLFVYDASSRRLRIEVGPTLQGIFTDAFVGYLMRHHVESFFASGNPTRGLRFTIQIVHARLRRAALGDEYDPRAVRFIENRLRLASGGGASAAMPDEGREPGFVNLQRDTAARRYFAPQPTPADAYRRYLEWMLSGRLYTDVDLFTEASQAYLAKFPTTRAFAEYVVFLEYGLAFETVVRGDLALLYITDDPLVSPHHFRRTPAGWQLDIWADVQNTREYVGGPLTWGMVERDDDFTRAFRDRYTPVGWILRVAGGDNRMLPTLTAMPWFQSPPRTLPGVEQLTVTEAAERIAAAHGRPAVVLLYSTTDQATRRAFLEIAAVLRRCQARGAEILAFAFDEDRNTVETLPAFLQDSDAPFAAIRLYPWPRGELSRAMAPLGIRIAAGWQPPLVAVLSADGRVVAQVEGIVDWRADFNRIAAVVDEISRSAAGNRVTAATANR